MIGRTDLQRSVSKNLHAFLHRFGEYWSLAQRIRMVFSEAMNPLCPTGPVGLLPLNTIRSDYGSTDATMVFETLPDPWTPTYERELWSTIPSVICR
jgi:hypothetical protein